MAAGCMTRRLSPEHDVLAECYVVNAFPLVASAASGGRTAVVLMIL